MKKKIGIVLLMFWVGVVSYGVTLMHSWHYADLSPEKSVALPDDLSAKKGVLHFITPLCSCSKEIYKHLISKGPLEGSKYNEKVIVVDDKKNEFSTSLRTAGYEVEKVDSAEMMKRYGSDIRGVPLLVIYNDEKVPLYVGGYTNKSITPFTEINYRSFLTKIENKEKIEKLPVIGCAVSDEYKKMLDPFGLKYGESL